MHLLLLFRPLKNEKKFVLRCVLVFLFRPFENAFGYVFLFFVFLFVFHAKSSTTQNH